MSLLSEAVRQALLNSKRRLAFMAQVPEPGANDGFQFIGDDPLDA